MIRLLKYEDNNTVLEYLNKDPLFNLFMISDVESFGYDSEFQKVWGEYEDDSLVAILLYYRKSFVYYSELVRKVEPFVEVIKQHEFNYINGNKEIVESFMFYFPSLKVKDMNYALLDSFNLKMNDDVDILQINTYKEYCEHWDLLNTIEDFMGEDIKDRDSYARHSEELTINGSKRTYCVNIKGKMISVASTVAENNDNAMVISVATLKEYRKMGYSTAIMKRLCDDFINEKRKSLCLFYDNLEAGKMYRRLGFKDIGTFRLYKKVNSKQIKDN